MRLLMHFQDALTPDQPANAPDPEDVIPSTSISALFKNIIKSHSSTKMKSNKF